MTKYGEKITIDDVLMQDIATYMDDDIRESLHGHIVGNEEFLVEYLKYDPEFEEILNDQFFIEVE